MPEGVSCRTQSEGTVEIRIAWLGAIKRKAEPMSEHQCKRFKTVKKENGIRLVVACRECGKKHEARKAKA